MPAEWEQHERVWLAWPHLETDWPGKFAAIPYVFAEIARGIVSGGRCGLVVQSPAMQDSAAKLLDASGVDLSRIDWLVADTDRGWLRDCGAIWVRGDGGLRALHWRFTGWAKYANHLKDAELPPKMAAWSPSPLEGEGRGGGADSCAEPSGATPPPNLPPQGGKGMVIPTSIVLEGGAIEVDGEGTLITTEECLLSETVQCRNPGMMREQYEEVFARYLGVIKTIWLNKGIVGDDTHGHVDDLTRFVAPGRVVTMVEPNRSDPNHAILAENLARLRRARDAKGRELEIIELPMPAPVTFDGDVLPASYANFLITNGQVLVPVFNDPNDRLALNLLAEAMPEHTIRPIYARDLVLGLGTIHCLTQQQPIAA